MSDAIWPIDTKFLLGPDEGVSWVRLDFALARIAELEAEVAKANAFIELLKGMVEQLEDGEFEEYDLQDLMRRMDASRGKEGSRDTLCDTQCRA